MTRHPTTASVDSDTSREQEQPGGPATFLRTPLFETDDPSEAADYLKAAYGDHGVRVGGSEADFTFKAGTVMVGDLAFGRFHHTMRCRNDASDGIGLPTIIQQQGPHPFRVTSGRWDDTMKHGQSLSIAQHVPYLVNWEQCDMQVVMLPPAMLAEVAASRTDDLGTDVSVELHFGPALNRAADQHWAQVSHLIRQVAAVTNLDDRPLLREELARTLCTAALACFPNSTLEATAINSIQPTPDAVRRAVAYIDDDPDQPLGLVDIAEVARLSPRALQAAFRRHSTPPRSATFAASGCRTPTETSNAHSPATARPSPPSPSAGASSTSAASPTPTATATAASRATPSTTEAGK